MLAPNQSSSLARSIFDRCSIYLISTYFCIMLSQALTALDVSLAKRTSSFDGAADAAAWASWDPHNIIVAADLAFRTEDEAASVVLPRGRDRAVAPAGGNRSGAPTALPIEELPTHAAKRRRATCAAEVRAR